MPLRLRMFRPSRLGAPFWLCVVFFLLMSTFFFPKATDPYKPASFGPYVHWKVDPDAGCPPPPSASRPAPHEIKDGAKPLLPADLLCRPLESDLTVVPKLIHQTWRSTELPAKFEKWSNACREKHPDWEYVLWTDEDNAALVRKYFPWLEDTYYALPGDIYRVDLVRNMYMYIFGGVYADLDTECLRSSALALDAYHVPLSGSTSASGALAQPKGKTPQKGAVAVLGRMGNDTTFEHSIPNAWMAASPGNPFFLMPLAAARSEIFKSRSVLQSIWYDFPSAEQMTGPIALRKAVGRFLSSGLNREAAALAQMGPFSKQRKKGVKDEVVLLPGHWVYPYNWNEGPEFKSVCSTEEESFDAQKCQEMLQVGQRGSVSITYWSHTHRGKGTDQRNMELVGGGGGAEQQMGQS